MIPALIGAGALVGSTIYSAYKNSKSQKVANDTSINLSNTSLQRARADAESAGFSPWSVAGTNGASVPNIGASTYDYSSAIGSGASLVADSAMKKLELAQAKESLNIQKANAQIQADNAKRQSSIENYNLNYAKKNNLPYGQTSNIENQLVGLLSTMLGGQQGIIDKANSLIAGAKKGIDKVGHFGNEDTNDSSSSRRVKGVINSLFRLSPDVFYNNVPNILNFKGKSTTRLKQDLPMRSEHEKENRTFKNKKVSTVYDESSSTRGYRYLY